MRTGKTRQGISSVPGSFAFGSNGLARRAGKFGLGGLAAFFLLDLALLDQTDGLAHAVAEVEELGAAAFRRCA